MNSMGAVMFKSAVCALALFAASTCVIAAKAGGTTSSPIGTPADKTAAFKPLKILDSTNYTRGNGRGVTVIVMARN
jgi:hypothetical protein